MRNQIGKYAFFSNFFVPNEYQSEVDKKIRRSVEMDFLTKKLKNDQRGWRPFFD